jgi:hypothetical protein
MTTPTFKARLRGSSLVFTCPHCSKPRKPVEHVHGLPVGPKAAHCYVADSPFTKKGYVLELDEALT